MVCRMPEQCYGCVEVADKDESCALHRVDSESSHLDFDKQQAEEPAGAYAFQFILFVSREDQKVLRLRRFSARAPSPEVRAVQESWTIMTAEKQKGRDHVDDVSAFLRVF